jgi:hypothetical protein
MISKIESGRCPELDYELSGIEASRKEHRHANDSCLRRRRHIRRQAQTGAGPEESLMKWENVPPIKYLPLQKLCSDDGAWLVSKLAWMTPRTRSEIFPARSHTACG